MPLNLIFIQPGNYTIDDNGIPGDNISVIRDGNGVVIFTFAHPADALGFTVSTPGVNITVNFTDSMNAANFTIGSTDPDPMVGPVNDECMCRSRDNGIGQVFSERSEGPHQQRGTREQKHDAEPSQPHRQRNR